VSASHGIARSRTSAMASPNSDAVATTPSRLPLTPSRSVPASRWKHLADEIERVVRPDTPHEKVGGKREGRRDRYQAIPVASDLDDHRRVDVELEGRDTRGRDGHLGVALVGCQDAAPVVGQHRWCCGGGSTAPAGPRDCGRASTGCDRASTGCGREVVASRLVATAWPHPAAATSARATGWFCMIPLSAGSSASCLRR